MHGHLWGRLAAPAALGRELGRMRAEDPGAGETLRWVAGRLGRLQREALAEAERMAEPERRAA